MKHRSPNSRYPSSNHCSLEFAWAAWPGQTQAAPESFRCVASELLDVYSLCLVLFEAVLSASQDLLRLHPCSVGASATPSSMKHLLLISLTPGSEGCVQRFRRHGGRLEGLTGPVLGRFASLPKTQNPKPKPSILSPKPLLPLLLLVPSTKNRLEPRTSASATPKRSSWSGAWRLFLFPGLSLVKELGLGLPLRVTLKVR